MFVIALFALLASAVGLAGFTLCGAGEIKDARRPYRNSTRADLTDWFLIGGGALGSLACFVTALRVVL